MSSSILTNNAALTALFNLRGTESALAATEKQIATGLRVSSASDNPAYWSIATKMLSDKSALSAVSDSLGFSSALVSTASSAVTSVLTIMNQMKADLVAARSSTDLTSIQTDIAAQQASLKSILGSASFNGTNLLDGTNSSVDFVTGFARTANGATAVLRTTFDATGSQLAGSGGILARAISGVTNGAGTAGSGTTAANTYVAGSVLAIDVSTSGVTATDITAMQAGVESAISAITKAATNLGSVQTTISNQQTFVSSLSDAITTGVGALVDADLSAASTRLQALQTRQQLGIQALAIANQTSSNILKLFE